MRRLEKITEGMDIVNKIAETATDYSDRPLEEQREEKGDCRIVRGGNI